MKRALCAASLLCGGTLLGPASRASEAVADTDLLEFLGSVDSNEAGWHDYLEQTDVDKVVNPGRSTPAPAAAPAQPAAPVPRKVQHT